MNKKDEVHTNVMYGTLPLFSMAFLESLMN